MQQNSQKNTHGGARKPSHKKLGIALGSGGARGIAHIGFLQALEEAHIRVSYITGCSMGAVVGALYAANIPMEQVKKEALSLKLMRIASFNVAPLKNGLFNMGKAKKLLESYLGSLRFSDLKIPFACVATDLTEGKLAVLDEGNVVDAVIASSSIPGAFTPAELGGRRFVDGGILERVPVNALKKMGAEVIVAVDVLGDLMQKNLKTGTIDTLLRCIDIMDTRSTQGKKRARSRYVDLWLEPALGAMDQYRVDGESMRIAYETGYALGIEVREKIKKLTEN